MLKVLPGGQVITVKVDYLALERRLERGPRVKTPAKKAIRVAATAGTVRPHATQASARATSPAKMKPRQSFSLAAEKARLAALAAPLPLEAERTRLAALLSPLSDGSQFN